MKRFSNPLPVAWKECVARLWQLRQWESVNWVHCGSSVGWFRRRWREGFILLPPAVLAEPALPLLRFASDADRQSWDSPPPLPPLPPPPNNLRQQKTPTNNTTTQQAKNITTTITKTPGRCEQVRLIITSRRIHLCAGMYIHWKPTAVLRPTGQFHRNLTHKRSYSLPPHFSLKVPHRRRRCLAPTTAVNGAGFSGVFGTPCWIVKLRTTAINQRRKIPQQHRDDKTET